MGEDSLFGRDVAVKVAMPVEMVRREIEPDGDPAAQAVAEVELEGGQLEHEHPTERAGIEIQHGIADIAA